jgi:hypothetical protein
VELFVGGLTALADSGDSSSIRSAGGNEMTVPWSPAIGTPGSTSLELEVAGTPVPHHIVKFAAASWAPTIQICSRGGPAVGAFTNITYFASPSALTS